MPTLAIWHGKQREPYLLSDGRQAGGDCEITAFALYRDLCRAKLDADWSLVGCVLDPVGLHYWNVCRPEDGEAQAVNVNMGRVLVIPLSIYLAANAGTEDTMHAAASRYVGRLYAAATRMGDPRTASYTDAAAFDLLTSEAFGMPLRFPPELHEAAAREAIE